MSANRLKDYFDFSKKERTGIITLLALLIIVWILPQFITSPAHFDQQDFELFRKQITQLKQKEQKEYREINSGRHFSETDHSSIEPQALQSDFELFYFDPNLASQQEWKRLGIGDKTIQTIHRYINKGGKFYKAEDIGRIYGLRKSDYNRLLPYVRITQNDSLNEKPKVKPLVSSTALQKESTVIVEINSADTSAFIALPGIGSKLAGRIIKFREKLGGFYDVKQIAEVYGLADSVFEKIKSRLQCKPAMIKQININTITFEELKAHPYIKYQLANTVIQYRNQHGSFQSPEDIKHIQIITDDVYKKILPYLTVY